MAATREQIMAALFALLSPGFTTTTRRLRDPEGLDPTETPALFLMAKDDEIDRKDGYNQRAKRVINAIAIVYVDVGNDQNAIPETLINNLIDGIETALTPPTSSPFNTVTLGAGIQVQAAYIDGTIERASGDVTGKALAVVPIKILIP